jgi:hypothetical protein
MYETPFAALQMLEEGRIKVVGDHDRAVQLAEMMQKR